MPDLSAFPTYISIPLLIAFAILVLVSRFLDVSEKWAQWSQRRAATKQENPTGEDAAPRPGTSAAEAARSQDPLVTSKLLVYAFFGGIIIPLVYAVVYYLAAPLPQLQYHYLVTLLSAMVYAAIASFVTLYLRRRIPALSYNKLAVMASGYLIATVLAMPLNIVTTLVSLNRLG